MGEVNLLKETIEKLAEHDRTPTDVQFVRYGKGPFFCSWDDFAAAANFTYDNGYGGAEVDTGLRIVGADWWLERGEYDGSEWWEFKTLPVKPESQRTPIESDLKDRY